MQMSLKKHYFHLWLPGITFKGGIQTYSTFLLIALRNIFPTAECRIFLKNDISVTPLVNESILSFQLLTSISKNTQTHFFGAWPKLLRTLTFVVQIIESGLRQKPNLLIVGHI